MPSAAIYVRLSQDRDGTKTGTERQERDCRALAKREALTVTHVYRDDDTSAYSGKRRPGFEQMLADLHRYDVVIYWKTDRLVRRIGQFFRVLEAAEAAGTKLLSVHDQIDTSTPLGKGIAGVIASMGEQESANISLRVRSQQEDAARKGRPHGHRRGFGYTTTSEVIDAEAEAIREARDRVLAGDSMRSICDDWNRRNVAPVSAPAWRVTTFKRMITGPKLAGLRVYRGEVVGPGDWPAILTVKEHRAIVAALGDPKVRSRGRPARYLLTGLIRCGRCDAVLRSGVRDNGERKWVCRRVPGDDSHCGRLTVAAKHIDPLIEAALLHRIQSGAVAGALRARPKGSATSKAAREADQVEQQIVQLGLDHDAGMITRREWLARREPLRARLASALAIAAQGTGSDGDAVKLIASGRVADRWDTLGIEQQRAIGATLIDAVRIAPAAHGGHFDAERVSIAWRV